MSRWPGRLITKTPVTPGGTAPTASAPGVWTLPEMAYWKKQGLWPDASADPYWSYVSYLLGTTSTNAAQNNTFLDSSTNNFTLTRFGNATQGSFSPYDTLWSNYFDGTSDSLSYTGGSSIAFGTADFTIELWAYLTNTGTYSPFLRPDDSGVFPEFGYDFGTGQLKFDARNSAIVAVTTTMPTAQWVHLVACRSGTNLRLFVNGSQVGTTTTNSTNFGTTTGIIRIGGSNFSASHTVNGYLSSFRVVKGTAIYTSAFTPSATPLTAVSGTSLLTCQSNRFLDNSTNNFTITKNGDTRVAPFSPFILAPPGYDTSVNGGSGYFDGSGDGITAPNNAAFNLGSGDFTLECWVYNSEVANNCGYAGIWGGGYILYREGTTYRFYYGGPSGSPLTSSIAAVAGAWTHLAVVRNGTTLTFYVNGVSGGSTNVSTTAINFSGQPFGIGANFETGSPGYPFTGYISNLRLVKGTAVYTSAFTPPTAPLTAISGTSILCNFTNAGIYDASMNNDMETVGNAQVSTGQAKYGTTSAYFDGSGDYLVSRATPTNTFGTGDFTVECWLYRNSATTAGAIAGAWTGTASTSAWLMTQGNSSANNLRFGVCDGTNVTFYEPSSAVISNGTWVHLAVTRASGTLYMFAGGTLLASYSNTTNISVAAPLGVAAVTDGSYASNCYIDDLRITKGYARYTSNFTPPTAALPVY